MEIINDAVDTAVQDMLTRIGSIPAEQLVAMACIQNESILETAYKQALGEFEDAQKQVNALENEAV